MREQLTKENRLSDDERVELTQLRRIDVAARAFVDANPIVSIRCSALWDDLLSALYDPNFKGKRS